MREYYVEPQEKVGRLAKSTYDLYVGVNKSTIVVPDYVGPIIKGIDVGRSRYTDDFPTYPLVDLARDVNEKDVQFKDFYCRFYEYDKHEKDCPIFFFIHGGGFTKGKLPKLNNIGRYLAYINKAVAVHIEYELAPEVEWPKGINECYEAISYFYEHSDDYGFDKKKIVVIGESAGANMAAAVSLMDKYNKHVSMQVLVYPVVDLSSESSERFDESYFGSEFTDIEYKQLYTNKSDGRFYQVYANENADPKDELLSPYFAKDYRDFPRTIVMAADYDFLTFESYEFAKKLDEAGVDVDFVKYNGTFHAFFTRLGVLEQSEWAMDFIKETCENYFKEK